MHQTREVVPSFALQLGGVPEPVDEPRGKRQRAQGNQVSKEGLGSLDIRQQVLWVCLQHHKDQNG